MVDDRAVPETWHWEVYGERKGPISEDDISKKIESGELSYGSLVWQKGFKEWVPIENTTLKNYLVTPPPLTGTAVSNKIIWVLAFAPIIGLFLEGVVAGAIAGNIHNYWFITLILNIGLSVVDEKKLKKAGHDTSKMGTAWLVPVYLYKRARILKHNLSYFIVWLVCFGLMLFA